MMRLLGFMAGSALTAAALMAVVEISDKPPPADPGEIAADARQARPAAAEFGVDRTPGTLPSSTTTRSQVRAEGPAQASRAENTARATENAADADPAETSEDGSAGESGSDLSAVAAQIARQVDSAQTATVYAGTYLFWSPFASEWGARGFARRLSAATQVPVEVLQSAPHQYRVGFNYRDETQRSAWIERIQSVTGLELEPASAPTAAREASPAPVP